MVPSGRTVRLMRLGGTQLWMAAMMLCLVLLVATAALWPQLAQEYVLTVRAPSLEQEFGFHGEYIGRAYVLTEVAEGGRLSQAGFRAGDHPSVGMCRFYGDYVSAEAFLDDLQHVQAGHPVKFTVARGQDAAVEFVRLTLPARARPGAPRGMGKDGVALQGGEAGER